MAEFPALNFYTDAFMADTSHLDVRATGAYFCLLMASWRIEDGGLPDSDKLLARMARCTTREWKACRALVMAFWTMCEDGKWRQKRLEIERNLARDRSQSAARAAKAKWLEINKRRDADASPAHMPEACGSDATTSTSKSTSIEIEETPSPESAREPETDDWPTGQDGAPVTFRPPSERRTSRGLRRPPDLVQTTGPPEKIMKRQDRAEGDLLNVLQTKLGRTPEDAWNLVIAATQPEHPEHEQARRECLTISKNFRLGWFPDEALATSQ